MFATKPVTSLRQKSRRNGILALVAVLRVSIQKFPDSDPDL